MPIRIVHVAETIKGGIATYLRELLPHQAVQYGPGMITVIVPEDQICELPVPAGVELIGFSHRGGRLAKSVRLAAELWKMRVGLGEKTVLHAHSTFAGVAARLCAKAIRFRGSVVYCAHGWAFDRGEAGAARRIYGMAERLLAPWCDAVVCISRHDYDSATRVGIRADKLVLIRNASSEEPPRARAVDFSWGRAKLRLLFVGRLDRQKGVDVLADAMRGLSGVAECAVVGAAVVDQEARSTWPGNMHELGWRSPEEVQWLIENCDAVVVPSRWEGFGLVAIEAMRSGKPVIASAVGGLAEIVENGVTGVTFSPGSSDELQSILTRMSVDELAAMGKVGRERFASRYTMPRLAVELDAAYRKGIPD